jgi:hypothetical protein
MSVSSAGRVKKKIAAKFTAVFNLSIAFLT